MRKILLLGSFLLLSGLFINYRVLHTGKLTNPESLDKPVSQVITSEPANKSGMKESAVYHEIKGSSERLSDKEKQSNVKWKLEITDFAKKYSNYIYLNGQTEEKIVALTFDDGPDEKVTPKILDILKAYGEHANFFFTGQNVNAFPAVAQRAYMEGNLILNHSYSHPSFYNKTAEFVAGEISRTDEILRNVIGKVPVLVRPPYGIITDNVIRTAEARDDKLIIWSTDTFDWSQKDATHIAENVLQNVRPGEIVLMHSNSDKTQTEIALPQIIEGLRAKGYKIVLLDYLLNTNAYKN
jgi:peptidoglycan/xylan/chitin deacetylase (PgdA/CDA1 family)